MSVCLHVLVDPKTKLTPTAVEAIEALGRAGKGSSPNDLASYMHRTLAGVTRGINTAVRGGWMHWHDDHHLYPGRSCASTYARAAMGRALDIAEERDLLSPTPIHPH